MSCKMLLQWILTFAQVAIAVPQYDYIVVGGGAGGLVVANRLSENLDVSVLIVEAGPSVLHDEIVKDPDQFSYDIDTNIEWHYKTTPQGFGGQSYDIRSGKALGGTTAINGLAYVRPNKEEIDAWEGLGNEGWTWEKLWPYYLKSETFTAPDAKQAEAGATYDPASHGFEGPLHASFKHMQKDENDFPSTLNQTLTSLDFPWTNDLNTGKMRGYTFHPYTIDQAEYVRHDAARAYYWPYASRENLHVKFNTTVTRIVWKEGKDGDKIVASGVEVREKGQNVQFIGAKREVLLAAGCLKSSTVLELSGVGNPSILEQYEIPVHLNLPSVGESIQEQLNTSIITSTNVKMTGSRSVAYASASDIFGDSVDEVAAFVLESLPEYAEKAAIISNGALKAKDIEHLFTVQHDLIFNKNISIGEYIFQTTDEKQVKVGYWDLIPFARGSVHITSADPDAQPAINPNYGMMELDILVQVAMSKFIRKLYHTLPLQGFIANETHPGLDEVPENATYEVWMEWVKSDYSPNYHAIGTTSMLPREIGGVVDNRLRVYGTANVRVVDASIHPIQLCGHPMSSIYAIEEMVSDFIKSGL